MPNKNPSLADPERQRVQRNYEKTDDEYKLINWLTTDYKIRDVGYSISVQLWRVIGGQLFIHRLFHRGMYYIISHWSILGIMN